MKMMTDNRSWFLILPQPKRLQTKGARVVAIKAIQNGSAWTENAWLIGHEDPKVIKFICLVNW
jgi:hypothetical protein